MHSSTTLSFKKEEEECCRALSLNKFVCCMFLDIRNAYGCVELSILEDKLVKLEEEILLIYSAILRYSLLAVKQ